MYNLVEKFLLLFLVLNMWYVHRYNNISPNDNNPMNLRKLILQLKLGASHIAHKGKVARLKHLEKFYNKTGSDKCDLCGKKQEDTNPILFVCPHFRSD
jgi:hypothetical protein